MKDNSKVTTEVVLANPMAGIPMLVLAIVLMLVGVGLVVLLRGPGAIALIPLLLASIFLMLGLFLINPNQSKVITLFGRYVGTVRKAGFFWTNPFTIRRLVSLRAHNFNSDTLKVNDATGNPIEIGAVVVWRVENSAQALFDVEDFNSYVSVQTESALRHLASTHPYDATDGLSLRGSAEVVNTELRRELTERLSMAGIEILEARLSHLAYAPEIASVMLQRQQADAIISARSRIVDGAVGMVEMALDRLKKDGILQMDDERRAAMVSNLLVVLCAERTT
ncbi:MAG: SPFH domain-containing protein, partial [Planctomycetota bacterium]